MSNNQQRNRIVSEETRRKISIANSGKVFSEEHKMKISIANSGRVFTEEHKMKISKSKKGLPPPKHKKGCKCFRCTRISPTAGKKVLWGHKFSSEEVLAEKNINWRGGVSKERHKEYDSLKYKEFRVSILERDSFCCCLCHKVGHKLHVHHIKPFSMYPNRLFDENNCVTLCSSCHAIVHSKRGEIGSPANMLDYN